MVSKVFFLVWTGDGIIHFLHVLLCPVHFWLRNLLQGVTWFDMNGGFLGCEFSIVMLRLSNYNHWLLSNIPFVQWEIVFSCLFCVSEGQTCWKCTCYFVKSMLWRLNSLATFYPKIFDHGWRTMMFAYLNTLGVSQNTDGMSLFWLNHDEAIELCPNLAPKFPLECICHNASWWLFQIVQTDLWLLFTSKVVVPFSRCM